MPSTEMRKSSQSAEQRKLEKYLRVDDEANPYHMYIPVKKITNDMRELLKGKNYIRIMTQLDMYQYIVAQYYWYTEEDMWVCGDALVFNNNPEKKIWLNVICTARKDFCLCYNEDYKEFISCCPNCKEVSLFIINTHWKCKKCHFEIPYNKVNDMPYAKLPCDMCPKHIGWDKCQESKEIVYSKLVPRQHIITRLQSEKIDELFNDFVNGNKKLGGENEKKD